MTCHDARRSRFPSMSSAVPLLSASGPSAGSVAPPLDASGCPGTRAAGDGLLHCFLVEDSPVIRENLVAMLQELLPLRCVGHAEDEAGALAWLAAGGPVDLMIIDIFLKAGTGLEVLRRARAARPEACLVVLSNYATGDMRRRCLTLGANRVFDKSSELDELIGFCETLAPRP
jgi:DNA-binding NarL/FixJ family response regulator